MDDLAYIKEVLFLHKILKIDAEINGTKEPMFTWGGLAIRPKKDNRISDDALNRKKSAEVIVPLRMLVWMRVLGRTERYVSILRPMKEST